MPNTTPVAGVVRCAGQHRTKQNRIMQQMADSTTDINESLRCPTCNAAQAWSDECRRCKSDLSLLRRVIQSRQQFCEFALHAIREQRYFAALDAAQRAHELYPDTNSRRLLASCQMLTGNWLQAVRLAREESS